MPPGRSLPAAQPRRRRISSRRRRPWSPRSPLPHPCGRTAAFLELLPAAARAGGIAPHLDPSRDVPGRRRQRGGWADGLMLQSFGLLAEPPGFVGPATVLAHLLKSLRDVNPVPDTGDAVTPAQQFLSPGQVRLPAVPRQVTVGPADPAPAPRRI